MSILVIVMMVVATVTSYFAYSKYKVYSSENKQSDTIIVSNESNEIVENNEVEEIEEIEVDAGLIEEERKIVESAYDLLWNKAIKAEGTEKISLLRKVQTLVQSYKDFKSDYKVDAHIIYLYTKQSLLINDYRENMSGNGYDESGKYDNHETYRQKFVDRNKATMVKNLEDIDPNNNGVFLPEHVMSSLQTGLKNFFDITKEDWNNIYNNKSINWAESAKSEAKLNEKLRTMSPQIGMSQEEVIKTKWGRPEKVNKTTTAYGTREQWVYPNYNYLYFEDGILTSIQN